MRRVSLQNFWKVGSSSAHPPPYGEHGSCFCKGTHRQCLHIISHRPGLSKDLLMCCSVHWDRVDFCSCKTATLPEGAQGASFPGFQVQSVFRDLPNKRGSAEPDTSFLPSSCTFSCAFSLASSSRTFSCWSARACKDSSISAHKCAVSTPTSYKLSQYLLDPWRGWPRSVPIFLFSSDLFRSAFLVCGNTPICSDLLRFCPLCSDLFFAQNKLGKPLSVDPFSFVAHPRHIRMLVLSEVRGC